MTTSKKTSAKNTPVKKTDQSLSVSVELSYAGREVSFKASIPRASKEMVQDMLRYFASGVQGGASFARQYAGPGYVTDPPPYLDPTREELDAFVKTGQWPARETH